MIAIDDVANLRDKKLDLLAMLYKDPILCGQYLFPNHFFLPVARWHKKYIRFLAEGHKYSLIVAPRGHAKTTCTQFYHIVPRILFKQEKYILIISNTYDQATKIIKSLEMELATNERLIGLFGQLKGDIWREDQFTTTTGVYVQAVGGGQKIRGFKYGETRPTLIYIDDMENDLNVKNEDQRDELIKWFYGAVLPALSVDGKIIITGTILHYDSLLMRLSVDEGWNKLWFSAEVNADKKIPLWKEMKDWDELMKIKQSYYNVGLIDQYNCEYLNDPVPSEAGAFQKSYFRYFTDEEVKLSDLNKVIITDFAFSDNAKSDYNVVMVCGMDGLGKAYVIDYVRFRWNNDTQEIMDAVFQKSEQYGVTKVGIETITAQRVMVTIFNSEMKKRNKRLQLVELKQYRTAKNNRIEAELQSRFKAGDIYHRKWMLELEDELLKFPKAKHDDLVDCLSRVFEILREGKKSSPLKLVLPRQHSANMYNKYPLVARF